MDSLSSGVLKKLIEEMDSDPKDADRKPVLLQVRSIIPVLGEGNLWPNHGFYLKVSDLTHAIYASLPHDQDDIILYDELHLGQHIYVERLERCHPVPVLRGLTPVPGRHDCSGAPKDLILAKRFTPSGLLGSEILTGKDTRGNERKPRSKYLPSISPSKSRANNVQQNFEGAQIQKFGSNFGDKDSDSDSSRPTSCSSSLPKSTRRSWNGSELEIVKEISEAAAVAKTVTKSVPNSRKACVSPIHSFRDDSSDDNSIAKLRRKKNISVLVTKPGKTCSNNKILSKTIEETLQQQMFPSSPNDRRAERTISWDSLPPTIVNLGKELLEQRDMAMHSAAQALQEAAAAERLLKTLRKFAEFPSSKENDLQPPSVENCLKLQEELAHSRLVIESLTKISPLRTRNAHSRSSSSIKEVVEVAIQRKKQANKWIKSAVASDISPCSTTSDHVLISSGDTETAKRAVTPSRMSEQKTIPSVRRRRKGSSVIGVVPYGKDHPQECTKGSPLQTASELATSMEEACRKWFLEYLEDFLDKANANDISKETNYRIAGMMSQFKKVDEWIEEMTTMMTSSKEEDNCHRNGSRSEDILEHCKRVRNKIYMFLLNHVERTASAMENMNSISQNCHNADEGECVSHLDEP